MKLKQNSFETVLNPFCFSFISMCGQFVLPCTCFFVLITVVPFCVNSNIKLDNDAKLFRL